MIQEKVTILKMPKKVPEKCRVNRTLTCNQEKFPEIKILETSYWESTPENINPKLPQLSYSSEMPNFDGNLTFFAL